jgi:hypothetical protein
MASDETVQERVQELTWALVDEQIHSDELQLLESLLLSDDAARDTYLDCVQLHADLVGHFDASKAPQRSGIMPVLGFLSQDALPADAQPSSQ